ncbi:hypothetical protein ACFL1R_03905 [Candidatus Latescibacterota bacterium]
MIDLTILLILSFASVDSLQLRIDNMNKRIEARRAQYIRKFTELERTMARLESLQQRLTSALAALPPRYHSLVNECFDFF